MSRYAALDLAALPDASAVVALDYDATLAARLSDLEAHLGEVFEAGRVAEIMAIARNIKASPTRYLNEAGAARELYMGNRINEAVRSIFLAMARGPDLDQLGANRGVARYVLDDSDPDNVVMEDDETFRARIQLVLEAYSPHGTEGSYVYWALAADERVRDVVPYGPDSGVTPPIPPSEPVLIILSREGDGTALPDLIAAVYDNCVTDKRRPIGDKLTVRSATPILYAVEAVLHVISAAAGDAVIAAAQAALDSFLAGRLPIGRKVYRTSLAAAMMVDGVVDVELVSPAADVDIGPYEAGHCTSTAITVQTVTGSWRNV
ncbi:MAG: baseplate J/gp47 family protein [Paracoccaceae bacterium]